MQATLRNFFRRYDLSVQQYGEILVAMLLNGCKLGESHPSYDICTTQELMKEGGCMIRDMLVSKDGEVRVEVKSKLAETQSGRASIVNVSEAKMGGKRRRGETISPMTHMIVILVNPDGETKGNVDNAWLLNSDSVPQLLRGGARGGTRKHINISDLRKGGEAEDGNIREISEHFSEVLSRPLFASER